MRRLSSASLKSPSVPARGPPVWEDALEPLLDWNLFGQSEFKFDQRLSW